MADLDLVRGGLALGFPLEIACIYADLPISLAHKCYNNYKACETLEDYDKLSREELEIGSIIAKGVADFHANAVSTISSSNDWRAKAWLLERKLPDIYSEQVLDTEATIKSVFECLESTLEPEIYEQVLKKITSNSF